ncbi:MAG: enoyl-CoA hydratase [Burkholderiales bacterium]
MSHIQFDVRGPIAHIVIDRPDKRNAITSEMYAALADAIEQAETRAQVRAMYLHGSAECFSAGNDLKDFMERPPEGEEAPVSRFLRVISSATKPIVAAVGGPAVGIGTTMLLHCDFVYATTAARFQLPFVSLGLVPEAASSLLLPMIAGYRRAAELLMLGKPFTAETALAAGIVTEIVTDQVLLLHGEETARALAALPPASVRLTKQLMKEGHAGSVAARILRERDLFRAQLASPEAKEAFTAFFEKRAPDFSRF